MNLPDDDFFPADAAIAKFTDRLYAGGMAEVFSTGHLLATRILLSNSFPGKSAGFLLAWSVVDLFKWAAFQPRKVLSCLFVDNSPRIRNVNFKAAQLLMKSTSVAWMTSPPRRLKMGATADGVVPQDVLLSLATSCGPSLGVFRRALKLFSEARRMAGPLARELDVSRPPGILDFWMHAVLLARAENYCERHAVDAVVLASDTEHFGIALAWAARQRGAEIFVLQHGTLNPHNCFGIASHLFCWTDSIGDYAARVSQKVERKPALGITAVGGIHRVDFLPEAMESASDCLFLDQLSAHGLRMWGEEWIAETRAWLEQLAAEMPEKNFRIRCHPSLKETGARIPCGWQRSTEPGLSRDMEDSKILLTMNSTAGLEAGAMGRPVIFLWNEKMVWLDSMRDLEELTVFSQAGLKERIEMLLSSSEARWKYTARARELCLKHLGSPDSTVDGMVREIRKSLAGRNHL